MFQIPVENLDSIRKARRKVKSMLMDIGLDSCKELLQDLKGFDPGEKYFYNTSWGDISLWEPSGKKVRYRTKPYCCSLCKYSTKVLSSFRNHLHRCHEDEADQELLIPCPNCVFCAQPKVVGRHFRMFHAPMRKVQGGPVSLCDSKSARSEAVSFTCLKCSFANTLYYSMKKHVLVAHFHHLISSYFGLRGEEGTEPLPDKLSSDKYYCKKCGAKASSQDALLYHVLTSEVHRDLENRLRSVISEHIRRPGLPRPPHIAPKPAVHAPAPQLPCFRLAVPQNSPGPGVQGSLTAPVAPGALAHSPPTMAHPQVTLVSSPLPVGQSNLPLQPSAPQPVFLSHGVPLNPPTSPAVLPLSPSTAPANKPLGPGVLPASPAVHPAPLPLGPPVGPGVLSLSRPAGPRVLPGNPSVHPGVLQGTSPGVISVSRAAPAGVLPAGQMTPAGVIPSGQTATSGVLPAGQMVQSGILPVGQTAPAGVVPSRLAVPTRVLPSSQAVPLQVLPSPQAVPPALLPPGQPVSSAALPVGPGLSSGVLQLSQPVLSGVLPVGPPARPGVLQLGPSVNTSLLPAGQPSRGPTPSATFLTAGSILRQLIPTGKQVNGIPTYTLAPVSVTLPGPPVVPPQLPLQLLPSGPATGMPSPPVLSGPSGIPATGSVEAGQTLRQAKQWKTCPVCNELFPSNVYQVHMEVAHRHSEARAEKREPEKLAALAPFLKWVRDKTVRCLPCKCPLAEAELMQHLLAHGLGCLFCPRTFHDLRGLGEHGRTQHHGQKPPVDPRGRACQLDLDANGSVLFPHLDFSTMLPREALGEREVYLAVLAGVLSKAPVPVYIKVRPQVDGTPGGPGRPALTCPFCFGTFISAQAYELHLRERHHITPTVHTVLRSPAFKCIHCCGVYTGSMTLAAIAVHLVRCRSAPKDSNSGLPPPGPADGDELLLLGGELLPEPGPPAKRKLPEGPAGPEDPWAGEPQPQPPGEVASGPDRAASSASAVPFKRQRQEGRTEGPPVQEDPLQVLALDPRQYEDRSYEDKKQFLRDYFHKRPYPSKREIELLSSLLWVWKIDVASFFGKRRYICMKAIKNHQPSVLLGFDMSELRNVRHRLNFDCVPQSL